MWILVGGRSRMVCSKALRLPKLFWSSKSKLQMLRFRLGPVPLRYCHEKMTVPSMMEQEGTPLSKKTQLTCCTPLISRSQARRFVHPRPIRMLLGPKPLVQWAALRTTVGEMRVPPQAPKPPGDWYMEASNIKHYSISPVFLWHKQKTHFSDGVFHFCAKKHEYGWKISKVVSFIIGPHECHLAVIFSLAFLVSFICC